MKTRLLPIFLLLAVLLAATPLQVFAAETPTINIMWVKNPLVGNYPIRLYIYPGLYISENESIPETYGCGEVFRAIHDAIRDLHHVIARFVDEYPEYYQLILIRFINATDEATADITIKIHKSSGGGSGYAVIGENRPLRIGLLCNTNLTYNDYYSTFLHELFHVLGVDHANQPYTDGGNWELMFPAGPLDVKIYPSTLDLYALYVAHFEGVIGDSVTLPGAMKYEMVTPYTKEMQSLRQENERLKNQLDTLNALFNRVRRDRDALRDKLAEVNASLQDLREQYQAVQNILDSYIHAYNTLQQKYENLRGNCSLLFDACRQCAAELNKTYHDYANLTARYNQLVDVYRRIYEDHQKLQAEYDDLAGRFTFLAVIYFAVVAILGGGALWVSIAYGRLRDKYHELLEKLEGGEKNE
jgi:regulator of replication initiation timing